MPKTALVIGGNGGIGSAVSKYLLERGLKVYASYFRNQERIGQIKAAYKGCEILKCDVRKEEEVRELVDAISRKDPHIDLVVNCATPGLRLKSFDRLTHEEFLEDMNVILFGSLALFKSILPQIKEKKSGVIVNLLTSTVTEMPPARMSSYVIAKYALLGLTKSLATELDRFHIKVFGLSPAFVETELIKVFPEKLLEIEKDRHPDKQLLQPDDVAEAVWHLFKGADRHQTGENFVVKSRKDVRALISSVAPRGS